MRLYSIYEDFVYTLCGLQTRIQTRSWGDFSAIMKLNSDYLKIQAEIEEWGAIVSKSCQPVEFIESKCGGIYKDIELCISRVSIARGNILWLEN